MLDQWNSYNLYTYLLTTYNNEKFLTEWLTNSDDFLESVPLTDVFLTQSSPDWTFWNNKPVLTLEEFSALAIGIDPEKIDYLQAVIFETLDPMSLPSSISLVKLRENTNLNIHIRSLQTIDKVAIKNKKDETNIEDSNFIVQRVEQIEELSEFIFEKKRHLVAPWQVGKDEYTEDEENELEDIIDNGLKKIRDAEELLERNKKYNTCNLFGDLLLKRNKILKYCKAQTSGNGGTLEETTSSLPNSSYKRIDILEHINSLDIEVHANLTGLDTQPKLEIELENTRKVLATVLKIVKYKHSNLTQGVFSDLISEDEKYKLNGLSKRAIDGVFAKSKKTLK